MMIQLNNLQVTEYDVNDDTTEQSASTEYDVNDDSTKQSASH